MPGRGKVGSPIFPFSLMSYLYNNSLIAARIEEVYSCNPYNDELVRFHLASNSLCRLMEVYPTPLFGVDHLPLHLPDR